uniref:Uncharacterized protein n=1 Tax=viral metagenome TaxID=1070528 RepID=A0A6C0L6J9_9ZZZZ
MLSDIQIETAQLVFSIEKEIVLMELREMLEKTAKLERIIRQAMEENPVVDEDTFTPCLDIVCPPKKKMRKE